jgi:hypothetical protein
MAMKLQRVLSLVLLLLAISSASVLAGLSSSAAETELVAAVRYDVVNVRGGPGTDYPILATAVRGQTFFVTGRNAAGDWLQVCCVKESPAWIWQPLLRLDGELESLPIVRAPARFTATPTPTPTPSVVWRGEYFANRDLAGPATLARTDSELNFRWVDVSPGPRVPATNFSARWSCTVWLDAADYDFVAQADDGVRVYLDNRLILDAWREQPPTTYRQTVGQVAAGAHDVRVEYFQAHGDATIFVWWEKRGQFPDWRGEYFEDIKLQAPPLLVRNDPAIDFNWGLGSPHPAAPADNFSVRWTRQVSFEPGNYDFFARTSDGVRIYVDGWLALDEWRDTTAGYVTYTHRFDNLGGGVHTVVVEYYERGGIAYAMVWWEKR